MRKFSEKLTCLAAPRPETVLMDSFHTEIWSHSSLEMTGHPLLATAPHLKLDTQTETRISCSTGRVKPNESYLKKCTLCLEKHRLLRAHYQSRHRELPCSVCTALNPLSLQSQHYSLIIHLPCTSGHFPRPELPAQTLAPLLPQSQQSSHQ